MEWICEVLEYEMRRQGKYEKANKWHVHSQKSGQKEERNQSFLSFW